jgi:hypothetical protein
VLRPVIHLPDNGIPEDGQQGHASDSGILIFLDFKKRKQYINNCLPVFLTGFGMPVVNRSGGLTTGTFYWICMV